MVFPASTVVHWLPSDCPFCKGQSSFPKAPRSNIYVSKPHSYGHPRVSTTKAYSLPVGQGPRVNVTATGEVGFQLDARRDLLPASNVPGAAKLLTQNATATFGCTLPQQAAFDTWLWEPCAPPGRGQCSHAVVFHLGTDVIDLSLENRCK